MALIDNASLVLIPSGTKANKLYSVIPYNGNGDFDFTRGSTATRVNQNGLIETVASGVPRLDYPLLDGVVQDCPALLLEPSRTNLQIRSEEFDNVAWGKQNAIVTANQATAPDGNITADKCATSLSGANQVPNLYSNSGYRASVTSGTTYSFSYFAKAGTTTHANLRVAGTGFTTYSNYVKVNLSTGTITSGTATLDSLSNGWYKINVIATANANGEGVLAIDIPDKNGNWSTGSSFDGDEFIYIWGAMIEAGSYPTSYIPTSGFAVTRSADVCNGAGTSSLFNDSEGVLYTEIQADAVHSLNKSISLSDGTGNNRIFLRESSGTLYLYVFSGGASQVAVSTTELNVAEMNKICAKYKANDFSLWVNGYELATDTSGITPTGLSDVSFTEGGATENYYGKTKQLMTFNEALSDTELEALTSWTSFSEMATEQLYTIE